MQRGGLYFLYLALCCIHTESEPIHVERSHKAYRDNVRRRRSDEKDGHALSREIFKNITKHLRDNIVGESATESNNHLVQGKVEESRQFIPHQGYHHHEHHWGPYFEEEKLTYFTVRVGSEALLACRVSMLKDKTVMWLRNTTDSAQLLTVGPAPYAGDSRIAVKFQYPNNWRLSLNPVKASDAGLYMCQISTHPPRTIFANLTVLPPLITINGDQTHEMKDRFYKAGSSIQLSCIISDEYIDHLPKKSPPTTTRKPSTTTTKLTTTTETTVTTVFNKLDIMLNRSWSVETTTSATTKSLLTTKKPKAKTTTEMTTTQMPTEPPVVNNFYGLKWKKQGKDFFQNISWRNMSATISVASASQNDSGTYTCQLQNHTQVTINVHVLIGENQAAVHHDTWNKGSFWQPPNLSYVAVIALLLFFT